MIMIRTVGTTELQFQASHKTEADQVPSDPFPNHVNAQNTPKTTQSMSVIFSVKCGDFILMFNNQRRDNKSMRI